MIIPSSYQSDRQHRSCCNEKWIFTALFTALDGLAINTQALAIEISPGDNDLTPTGTNALLVYQQFATTDRLRE